MLKPLYLGTCRRPDIVLTMLILYTRARSLTEDDQKKLESILGYLKMMAEMKMFIDNEPIRQSERINQQIFWETWKEPFRLCSTVVKHSHHRSVRETKDSYKDLYRG